MKLTQKDKLEEIRASLVLLLGVDSMDMHRDLAESIVDDMDELIEEISNGD